MRMQFSFILFFVLFRDAYSAYFDTLPKGVRNFTFRVIETNDISGSYNSGGDFKGYNVNANINADTIKGINSAVDTYLNSLSASDYQNFSFGTFEGKASSKITAMAFGVGYGITDKLTFYGYIPFYKAVVDLKLSRTAKGRNNVGTAIQLENLPDVDVRIIQSLFVNYYHYSPLGKWEASDFGDTEIGLMYNLSKDKNWGSLINVGSVLPTGRKDNPDILQDISFGDGQYDLFFEFGGGYIFDSKWSADIWNRITYQFPFYDTIRLPDSESFPITSNKGIAKIKYGNKEQINLDVNYAYTKEWMQSLVYTFEYKEKDIYESSNQICNSILEKDTEKLSHLLRLNLNYSTVNLYKTKRFVAPLDFNLAIQSTIAGKNIPKYERLDLEARMYF